MASNQQILKTFLDQFNQFLEDIVNVFPNDKELVSGKMYFEGLRKINPRVIITYWKYLVADKYDDNVETENIDFFINKNYNEDIETIAKARNWDGDYSYINNKIEAIRDQIVKLSDNNKEITMKYIINLTRLSKLYN
tara:strand:+ start:732 stop:1142 length:411 start_codon:yes stop_codon:yes gene_type:complete